jgi:hypothetical protein
LEQAAPYSNQRFAPVAELRSLRGKKAPPSLYELRKGKCPAKRARNKKHPEGVFFIKKYLTSIPGKSKKLNVFNYSTEKLTQLPLYSSNNGDKHTRAQQSHEKTVEVKTTYPTFPNKTHNESANDGSHNADNNIPDQSPASPHQHRRYPSD